MGYILMKLGSPSQVFSIVTGLAVAMTGMVSIPTAASAATSAVDTPALNTKVSTKIAKKHMMKPKKKAMKKTGMTKKYSSTMKKSYR
jgi:flagellar biosynthesis protein FliP